jgi:adenosylcobinamide-phosphate synthase
LLVTLMIAVLALVVGTVIKAGAMQVRPAGVVDVVALLFLLSQRHAFDRARRVARKMAADDHAAARRAVEELAVSLGAGVLGVTFWYLVLGLPGLFVYGAVHAVAWRIGRGGGAFGRPAAGLDALLGIVPAVVAGWLIALAALFAPRGRPLAALGTMARARAKLPLWDAGGVTAAMAGALGFALGDGPWIGDGRARLVPQDVRNAAYLYAVACLIHMGAVAGALFALYSPI